MRSRQRHEWDRICPPGARRARIGGGGVVRIIRFAGCVSGRRTDRRGFDAANLAGALLRQLAPLGPIGRAVGWALLGFRSQLVDVELRKIQIGGEARPWPVMVDGDPTGGAHALQPEIKLLDGRTAALAVDAALEGYRTRQTAIARLEAEPAEGIPGLLGGDVERTAGRWMVGQPTAPS